MEARAECLSGDAGALLLRDLADRLGYRALLVDVLADRRNPERVRHPFGELRLTLTKRRLGLAHALIR